MSEISIPIALPLGSPMGFLFRGEDKQDTGLPFTAPEHDVGEGRLAKEETGESVGRSRRPGKLASLR